MTTINELAHEYGITSYGLRAFADDLLDGVADDATEIPTAVEAVLRDALPLEQQTPEEIRASEGAASAIKGETRIWGSRGRALGPDDPHSAAFRG